jgi:hypothetical protein
VLLFINERTSQERFELINEDSAGLPLSRWSLDFVQKEPGQLIPFISNIHMNSTKAHILHYWVSITDLT